MTEAIHVFDIGAHRILWTPSGGSETDMGLTEDGSEITVKCAYGELKVHELAALVDQYVEGIDLTVKMKLASFTLAIWAATLDMTKTDVVGPPAKSSIDLSPAAGRKSVFGALTLRPRTLTSADKTRDKTVHKAIVTVDTVMALKASKNRTVDLTFKGAAVQDAVLGTWKMFTEGDPTTATLFAV